MKMRNRAVWCEVAASASVPVASGNGDDLAGIYPSIRVMRCLGDTDQDTAVSASLSVVSGKGDDFVGIWPGIRATQYPEITTRGRNADLASHRQCIPAQLAHSVLARLVARQCHRESVGQIVKHSILRYVAICHLCRGFNPILEQRKPVRP